MKVLACDFDKTLYFRDEEPNFRVDDIEAIIHFQKDGNKFGICTGRHLRGILDVTKTLIDFDFYILNNGCTILDHNCEVIYQRYMEMDDVKKVLLSFPEAPMTLVSLDCHYIYATNFDNGWKSDLLKKVASVDDIPVKKVVSFSFHMKDLEVATQMTKQINAMELLIVAYQNNSDIDCIYRECSKGTGVKLIQKHYGCEDEEVAGIGDSFNDLPMLESVDQSFTFNNSPKQLKHISKYCVDSLWQAIDELMK